LKDRIPSPDIKPGAKGILKIQLPGNWRKYDVLYITAVGVDGKEIFTWSFPITKPAEMVSNLLQKTRKDGKVELQEEDSVYAVSANGIDLRIHKQSGMLRLVQNSKGIIPFNDGPVLQESVKNFSDFRHRFSGDTLIIESAFDSEKSCNTLQWIILPSGIVRMKVAYFPGGYFTWFNGVSFSFPEKEIASVEYIGDGPNRVWKNRLKGNRFGAWEKTYNNTETGETWNYPEFKGYHSKMYCCKFITGNQSFKVFTENEDLFLRLFTPAWKTDQWHNYEPLFPTGDISFMQGISSIGTKTQRNETTGPMGMKNIFYDYEKDPGRALTMVLYFDFSGKE